MTYPVVLGSINRGIHMTTAHLFRIAQRVAPGLAAVLAMASAAPSLAQTSPSGTYVSASPRSAEMIVLVRTPDGRLVGRLESSSLKKTGAVETSSAALEGAADGSNIVLNGLSGVIAGEVLDLSWEGGHRAYRRGTADQYRASVAVLETRSDQIEAQTAFATATANLARLTLVLDGIEAARPALNDQLSSASERYRDLFPRMHNRRRAQVILSQSPNQGLAGMQAGTDAQSVGLEIDAVVVEVNGIWGEWHRQFEFARTLTASVEAYCATGDWTSRQTTCFELERQRERLDVLRAEVQAEFDDVQAAYGEASIDVPPGRRLIENLRSN